MASACPKQLDACVGGSILLCSNNPATCGDSKGFEALSRDLAWVCKRKPIVYAERGWLKVRNTHYTQMEGRHEMFTAFRERPRVHQR
jgi:hypothetical protein